MDHVTNNRACFPPGSGQPCLLEHAANKGAALQFLAELLGVELHVSLLAPQRQQLRPQGKGLSVAKEGGLRTNLDCGDRISYG
jgi:hypothetical protein